MDGWLIIGCLLVAVCAVLALGAWWEERTRPPADGDDWTGEGNIRPRWWR